MKITRKIELLFKIITKKRNKTLKQEVSREYEIEDLSIGKFEVSELEDIEDFGKEEELLNSLIMFLKLIGEYNNIPFHKIMCKNLNYLDNEIHEFIVIKEIFKLYIDTYKSFHVNAKNMLDEKKI